MSFDNEFEQNIAKFTLEELQATKETLEQAYAMVNQLILERSATPTIVAKPDRWRLDRN